MKNQFLISEDEKSRILQMHENSTKNLYLNLITEESVYNPLTGAIQKKLNFLGFNVGTIDGKYGKKTACAVAAFQAANGLFVDGKAGKDTAKKIDGVEPYFPKDVNIQGCSTQQVKNKKESNKVSQQSCESILPETCPIINVNKETIIGNGGSEGCSEYVRKSIGETLGNAWKAFNVAKKYGVKYNMFTDGSIDWNNVRNQMKSNQINSSTCGCFVEEGDSKDKSCSSGSKISKTISSFYPSSSNFSDSSLKIGDIVGMYYRDSGNKGKAFCERAVQRGLDGSGNVTNIDPFTFNTHVGYVGAIKNGVPMIYHSVHGTRLSTPVNQLKSKDGSAMIVWVTGGPQSGDGDKSKKFDVFNDFKNFLKK